MPLRRRVRRCAGLAAALVLAAGILALAGSPAAAHANLAGTSPSSGAELDQPPDEVRLRFTERVTVATEGVTMRDSNGAVVSTEPASVAPEDPSAVVLPVPSDLADGSYVVTFRVVSADSHPVAGAIVFGVGVAAGSLDDAEVASGDPAVTAVFAVSRWTSYAGLALLAGGLGMFVLCWSGGWRNRRARRLVAVGWVASLAGAVAVLLLQGPYTAGRSLAATADPALLAATLDTDYGRYLVARLGLVAAAGALLLVAGRPQWKPVRLGGAVLVAVGLPMTWVGTGHANASGNPLDMVANAVHLIAMSTWFGGLALLVVCLLPRSAVKPTASLASLDRSDATKPTASLASPDPPLPADEVASAVRRFSILATSAVATLVITGTYVAWQRIGTLEAMLGTPYGRLLAFKLATMGVLLWLGSMSRSVVQRRYAGAGSPVPAVADAARGSRSKRRAARAAHVLEQTARAQLRGSVRLEVGTAVAVLAVATVLAATPPGVVVRAAETLAASSGPVLAEMPLDPEEDPAAGVLVLVDPAWVGENRVVVEVVRSLELAGESAFDAPSTPSPAGAPPPQGSEFTNVPWDVPEVRASFVLPGSELGPLPVELARTAPGVYQAATAQLPTAGDWRLELAVRTSEIASHTVQVDIPIS